MNLKKTGTKDQNRTPEEIAASEARYRLLVESIPHGIYVVDGDLTPIVFNRSLEKIFGQSIEFFMANHPQAYLNCIHPDDLPNLLKVYAPHDGPQVENVDLEYRIIRPDGEIRHVLNYSQVIRDALGKVLYFQGIILDNTDLKRAEDALRESEANLRLITDYMLDVVAMVDRNGIYKFVSPSSKSVWGYEAEYMVGRSSLEFIHPDDTDMVANIISSGMKRGTAGRIEYRFQHANGDYIWIETVGKPVTDETGRVTGGVYGNRDITERKLMEEKLKYLGLHDAMTGLYNRAYFQEEMQRLDNGRSEPLGVIICDVDGLKAVNDVMGHTAGDELLIAVAQLMKQCFRGGDVVARVGGDEFAVLLPGSPEDVVREACERLGNAIDKHNETALPRISLSVGYASRNHPSLSIDDLYRMADNNMYKEKGKKRKDNIIFPKP